MQSVISQGPSFHELMELLKSQQEQLNHLTQTVASLQALRPQVRTSRNGPLICRRCQQCDNVRVPARQRATSVTGLNSNPARLSHSSHQEN